jgi:hypothetical protein
MMTHKEIEKDQEWRKLCELVAHEPDPHRLSNLVDQLIKKLDTRRQELRTADQLLSPTEPKND